MNLSLNIYLVLSRLTTSSSCMRCMKMLCVVAASWLRCSTLRSDWTVPPGYQCCWL